MNKFILSILLIPFFTLFAQEGPGGRDHDRRFERIEELKKIKLIEELDMDEETTLRFFSRRSDFLDEMDKLRDEHNGLMMELEKSIKEGTDEFDKKLEKIFEKENAMLDLRHSFVNSLGDILGKEQIARYIVFEHRFHERIKDLLRRHKRR